MSPLALLTIGLKPTPQTQGPSFKINLESAQGCLDLTKTSKSKKTSIYHVPSASCVRNGILFHSFNYWVESLPPSSSRWGKLRLTGRRAGTCSIHRAEEAKGWGLVSRLLAATQVLSMGHTVSYPVCFSTLSALRVSTSKNSERGLRRWLCT